MILAILERPASNEHPLYPRPGLGHCMHHLKPLSGRDRPQPCCPDEDLKACRVQGPAGKMFGCSDPKSMFSNPMPCHLQGPAGDLGE